MNTIERKEMVKVLFKDLTIVDAEATFEDTYDGKLIGTGLKCIKIMDIIGRYTQ